MDTTSVQNILNYYLEYEIYNIISSSQIKVNNKTSIIVRDIKKEDISKKLNDLKEEKLIKRIEKFIGKKTNNLKEIVGLIQEELKNIDEQQSNKAQIYLRIKNVIRDKSNYNKKEKLIENFVDELCDIKTSKEFLLYAHNVSIFNTGVKKLPIFIFKCIIESERIKVIDTNINVETLNTILSVILNKEIPDVAIEYKEKILNYSKEIKSIIDSGDIQHILNICYVKLDDYIGISEKDIKEITKKNNKYNMNQEYIMSLDELSEEGIKNIKEDIELLNKLIKNDNYIPNLLKKYLKGNKNKKNMNNSTYTEIYRGNYKSNFGVGENQYKIVNTIKDNELIAIEGPPGTGKTSLLKEIIANKIVERADLILKNWDNKVESNQCCKIDYYDIDYYGKDEDAIKSIVVSSKNGEAIENVGKEINQEIEYMSLVTKEYKRTQIIEKEKRKVLQDYKGIICLPLGKQDNVQDFKEFLYKNYIPILKDPEIIESGKEKQDKVKEDYQDKCNQVENYEELINSLKKIKDNKSYFYGIEIIQNDEKEENEAKIQKIQKLFIEDKERIKIRLSDLKNEEKMLKEQKERQEEKLKEINKKIDNRENAIKNSHKKIVMGNNSIQNLKNQQEYLEKIFTKILNLKEYRKNRDINFFYQINEIEVENKIEENKILQQIRDKSKLEKTRDKIDSEYNKIKEMYENEKNKYDKLNEKIREMELIEEFNKKDKKTIGIILIL